MKLSSAVSKTKVHYEKLPFKMDYFREKIFLHSLTYPLVTATNTKRSRIVDVGCGMAFIGRWLKKHHSRHHYLGIDISQHTIELVKQMGIEAGVGNNLSLPMANECADLVISEGIIHHTPDPHKAFAELVRITRHSGKISLYVYNRWHIYWFIYKVLGYPCRAIYENRFLRPISNQILFPVFDRWYVQFANRYALKNKDRVPLTDSYNIYHDLVLTPIAHFFTDAQIRVWSKEFHLKVLDFKHSINGQGLLYLFERS